MLPTFDVKNLAKALRGKPPPDPQRENAHYVHRHNTAVTTESRIQVASNLGGIPARSLSIEDSGGQSLQVNINGEGWLDVLQGDLFQDETIILCDVRVLVAATGTAVLRFGAWQVTDYGA